MIALDCEHDWQVEHKRAQKAESELAALKKRIADAPMTAVGNLHLFEYHAPFVGKRVRLLEEDDNEP